MNEKIKARVGELTARLIVRGAELPAVVGLFVDGKILLADNERRTLRIVDECDTVCRSRFKEGCKK